MHISELILMFVGIQLYYGMIKLKQGRGGRATMFGARST